MKYNYVWLDRHGTKVYDGKGTNDRDVSAKNPWFEEYRIMCELAGFPLMVKRECIVEDDRQALTAESMSQYNQPTPYNLAATMSKDKWVPLPGQLSMEELLNQKANLAKARDGATPEAAALELAKQMPTSGSIAIGRDNFGKILKAYIDLNKGATEAVITWFADPDLGIDGDMTAAMKVVDDARTTYGRNIDVTFKTIDFLGADIKENTFDVVVMNPPFKGGNNGNILLWKQFLVKGLKVAAKGCYLIMPKNAKVGFENTVIQDHVDFEATNAPGKTVFVANGAKREVERSTMDIECKFKVDIKRANAGRVLDGVNIVPASYILISQAKCQSTWAITHECNKKDANFYAVSGTDMGLIIELAIKHDFKEAEVIFRKELMASTNRFQLLKTDVVQMLNKLWELEYGTN